MKTNATMPTPLPPMPMSTPPCHGASSNAEGQVEYRVAGTRMCPPFFYFFQHDKKGYPFNPTHDKENSL